MQFWLVQPYLRLQKTLFTLDSQMICIIIALSDINLTPPPQKKKDDIFYKYPPTSIYYHPLNQRFQVNFRPTIFQIPNNQRVVSKWSLIQEILNRRSSIKMPCCIALRAVFFSYSIFRYGTVRFSYQEFSIDFLFNKCFMPIM